jgi:hypothetical protein
MVCQKGQPDLRSIGALAGNQIFRGSKNTGGLGNLRSEVKGRSSDQQMSPNALIQNKMSVLTGSTLLVWLTLLANRQG